MKTLHLDVSHLVKARHHSGLVRLTRRMMEAMAERQDVELSTVLWHPKKGRLVQPSGRVVDPVAGDVYLQFAPASPEERPGLLAYLEEAQLYKAAVFHDAIPLTHPEITWPKSVGRHPSYMKSLATFDRVFAVSKASSSVLTEYWKWLGCPVNAAVSTIQLGADFRAVGRQVELADKPLSDVLMVGIVEPRKNQELLLDVWEGLSLMDECPTLHLVGRVNPHFGTPILKRIKEFSRRSRRVVFHGQVNDDAMEALYQQCGLALFPSIAEGCGLPVLEALWLGLPVFCSPLSSHQETAAFGGVEVAKSWEPREWTSRLQELVTDAQARNRLAAEINHASLPLWSATVNQMIEQLPG